MTLKVHHMGVSQGERIVWLCEELGLDYELVRHTRDPIVSPESLRSVPGNATGKSPFFEDTDANVGIGESAAICEYLIHKHGGGRFALKPDDKHYADYLYWFHYCNGTGLPAIMDWMFVNFTVGDNQAKMFTNMRLDAMIEHTEDRLKDNKYLAGPEFTAADIMTVYNFSTQRYFGPQLDLKPYPNIVRWLGDCTQRGAYQRAMKKGDPEMVLLTGAEPPKTSMFAAGGVTSDFWKKQASSL